MTKNSINRSCAPESPAEHPVNVRRSSRSAGRNDRNAPAPGTSVLVVIEDGFRDSGIIETLQREHHEISVARASDVIAWETARSCFDLILLCSRRSGRQCREMLEQITDRNPTIPVIVVTAPSLAAHELKIPMQSWRDSNPAQVDASLLLRTVRETLRGPAVKRLIRVTEKSGGARYVARNARWLSEELQSRYSTPFEWSPPSTSIPIRFESAGNSSSAQL